MAHDYDVLVVGAGAVGLAIAQRLSRDSLSVLVVERHERFGEETSSRNSEVIHAGLYYAPGSLKARLCAAGRDQLYALCAQAGIPHRRTGKLVVATSSEEDVILERLFHNATANGVPRLRLLSRDEARRLEPSVACTSALLSPETGILDAHALMRHCFERTRDDGGDVVFNTTVRGGRAAHNGMEVCVVDSAGDESTVTAAAVVNAAGLDADTVAAGFGVDVAAAGYVLSYARGCYVRYSGPPLGLSHLIYPVPGLSSLGIHLVLDMAGEARFGPDIDYLAERVQDYTVPDDRCALFGPAIRRYLPQVTDDHLRPGFAGIRPKVAGPNEPSRDFIIHREDDRELPRLVNCVGIASPGLTSCLAIADYVATLLL